MRLISTKPDSNGAYESQTIPEIFFEPNEYLAVVPDSIEYPSMFPYVYATIKNGYVTEMRNNEEAYRKAQSQRQELESALQESENIMVSALID